MICSILKISTLFTLLFSVHIYADIFSKASNDSQDNISHLESQIKSKKTTLLKTDRSNVARYISLYDEIAKLTIDKNKFLLQLDRVDEIDADKTCDLALNYEEVEFIKTEYYKTPFHDEVAKTFQNLASLYQQCHPAMVEKQLLPLLKIKKHVYSSKSIEVADTHELIADHYRIYMANFKKAIKEYETAKKIRENIFGSNDPRITKNYANLALSLYYHGDKLNRAEKLLLESIKIREDASAHKDFPLYRAYMDLGIHYSMKGRYSKSVLYLHKALESFKGEVNLDYIVIISELSQNHLNQNDLENALKFADEAYRLSKKFYQNDTHHQVLGNSLRLEEIKQLMKNHKEKEK